MSQLKDWEVLALMVEKDKSFNPEVEDDGGFLTPIGVCEGCEYPDCENC
jgi:hypothetical protein